MTNELFERELQNTSINDVSLADYVKENYVSRSVIEQIRADIADAFIKHGLGNTEICFDILQIIDRKGEQHDGRTLRSLQK